MATARHLKKWLGDPDESLAVQVPRALAASVVAAAVDCVVLFFFVDKLGCNRVPAAIFGYFVGAVVQYALCRCWVFPVAPQSAACGFPAFLALSLGGLAITWATMAVLADVYLPVSKVLALGLAFAWNFTSRRYLVFSARKAQTGAAG